MKTTALESISYTPQNQSIKKSSHTSVVPKHVPGASPTLHILHVSLSSGLGVATNELMS